MKCIAFRPKSTPGTGLTAATNDSTVSSSSERASIVGGSVLMVVVGAEPIFVTFGGAAVVADATTGLRLPANTVTYFMVPDGATHLAYIRAGASDSAISLIPGDLG